MEVTHQEEETKHESISNDSRKEPSGVNSIPRKSIRLMIGTSITGYWLLEALKMLQNLATLSNETTSPKVVKVELTRLWEDKKKIL